MCLARGCVCHDGACVGVCIQAILDKFLRVFLMIVQMSLSKLFRVRF